MKRSRDKKNNPYQYKFVRGLRSYYEGINIEAMTTLNRGRRLIPHNRSYRGTQGIPGYTV